MSLSAPRRRRSPSSPSVPQTLDDLLPDVQNANCGTARGQRALDQSLRDFGAARSIVIDRVGRIIAGNKTVERARALGLPLQVVQSDGQQLVALQRSDLDLQDDPKARQLALADNRVGELNLEWDPQVLEALRTDGLDLADLWTPRELELLLGHGLDAGQTPEDTVVPIRETTIKRGDLVTLGPHRILCGDATAAADVARLFGDDRPTLLITDPPYGVDYDASWRVRAGRGGRHGTGRVTNDDRANWGDAWVLFPGAVAYVWHAGLHGGIVGSSLTTAGFELRAQIIWVKPHFVLGRGDFHWQYEPCLYGVRAGAASGWCGDRTQSTVWTVPNLNPFSGGHDADNPVTGHSTQKPVALYERALLCSSGPGDLLYDPFLGAGRR